MATLPETWSRRRLRFDARVNPVKSELDLPDDTEVSFVPMDAVGELGGLRLDEVRAVYDVYNGYTYFRDGDVVIAKITPCFENGKGALAVGLTNGVGFGTTELHVVRPTETLDPRFLFYMTIARDFRCFGTAEMLGAGGQKRVPERFLKDWRPAMPLVENQRRVVTFLDEKIAQIDGLVAKKQALLDRLAEKRRALITQAVTKGLNPETLMKESGIGWLGQVPAHWVVCGLGQKIKLQRGVDLTRDQRVDGEFPVISSGGVEYYHDTPLCQPPGVLVGRKGSAGKLHYIETPYWPHDTTLYVREFRGNHPRFVWYLLHCLDMTSFDTGSANPTVNRNLVHPIKTPWPPTGEQKEIASSLDLVLRKSEEVGLGIERSIRFLSEYRSALITAAVTGQIEGLR